MVPFQFYSVFRTVLFPKTDVEVEIRKFPFFMCLIWRIRTSNREQFYIEGPQWWRVVVSQMNSSLFIRFCDSGLCEAADSEVFLCTYFIAEFTCSFVVALFDTCLEYVSILLLKHHNFRAGFFTRAAPGPGHISRTLFLIPIGWKRSSNEIKLATNRVHGLRARVFRRLGMWLSALNGAQIISLQMLSYGPFV